MLVDGVGADKPAQIAHIGQEAGLFGRGNQFVAKAVFVAHVKRHALVSQKQRGLGAAATVKTGQGHVHHAVQWLGDGGQGFVFAKGNEVVFGVKRDIVWAVGVVVA